MRAGDAGNGGARSSHALDLLGKNLDDDTHLAGPADGRDVGERLFREQVTAVLGNRRHGHSPLPLSSSSTEKAWRTDLTASVPPIKTPISSVSEISAAVAPWSRTSSTR